MLVCELGFFSPKKNENINKSTTALCQPKQKLNSEPAVEVNNVSSAYINTFVGGSYFIQQAFSNFLIYQAKIHIDIQL